MTEYPPDPLKYVPLDPAENVGLYQCVDCGALVANRFPAILTHDRFHDKVGRA